jgi:hypothetical protein
MQPITATEGFNFKQIIITIKNEEPNNSYQEYSLFLLLPAQWRAL